MGLLATASLLVAACPVEHPVPKYLGAEAAEALAYAAQSPVLQDHTSELPAHLLTPVVLPEVARYNGFSNFFETAVLEAFYVEDGSGVVDFSIGPFQMKPSFAERVEQRVAAQPLLRQRFPKLASCAGKDGTAERRARVDRLSSTQGQLPYLEAMVVLVLQDHPVVLTMCNADQTAFMASAYNGGFERSYVAIEDGVWMRCYPYGTGHEGTQLRYAEVAQWFAEQLGMGPE